MRQIVLVFLTLENSIHCEFSQNLKHCPSLIGSLSLLAPAALRIRLDYMLMFSSALRSFMHGSLFPKVANTDARAALNIIRIDSALVHLILLSG